MITTHTLVAWLTHGVMTPSDAYGRHSRDLAAVTAEYAAYLGDLPARLTSEYVCQLREATVDQVEWLLNGSPAELHHVFALDPGVDACATLLVGRGQFDWRYDGRDRLRGRDQGLDPVLFL